jgi:hypothetical protein
MRTIPTTCRYGSSKSLYPTSGIASLDKSNQPPKLAARQAYKNLHHQKKVRFGRGCGTACDMRSNGEVEGPDDHAR